MAGKPGGGLVKRTVLDTTRVMSRARAFTDAALNSLLQVAVKGKNENARVNAAKEILARGWGAHINIVFDTGERDVPASDLNNLSREQLMQILQGKIIDAAPLEQVQEQAAAEDPELEKYKAAAAQAAIDLVARDSDDSESK